MEKHKTGANVKHANWKQTSWKQIILGAIAFVIIAQIVHTAGTMLAMDYYTNPAYFPLWSNIMMPNNGPPGTEFMVASIVTNFIAGLILAWVYFKFCACACFSGEPGSWRKGFHFGAILFLVAGIPFSMTTYLLLAVPTGLLMEWAAEMLVVYLAAGVVFSKLEKK